MPQWSVSELAGRTPTKQHANCKTVSEGNQSTASCRLRFIHVYAHAPHSISNVDGALCAEAQRSRKPSNLACLSPHTSQTQSHVGIAPPRASEY
eukprot:7383604-Prymnesium_polylepis.1